MNALKSRLVPMLFALSSAIFFVVAVVKPLDRGEPVNTTFLVFAFAFLVFALVFFAIGRKSGGGSGPPSA